MKVILLKNVAKLGKKFEVKDVSDGHALNMLIPQGYAEPATASALKKLEARKAQELAAQKKAEEVLAKNLKAISGKVYEVQTNVNEKGHLFAAIDATEISKLISEESKIEIPAQYIQLEKPIKEAGEHRLTIAIGESFASITLNVSAK